MMVSTGQTPDIAQCIEHPLSTYHLTHLGSQLSIFLETINEASIAFLSKQNHLALQKYKIALDVISEIGCKDYENILQYMLCIIWLESTSLQDLLEALKCLHKLESVVGDNFPAVYYALGKAHMKFCRFEMAQETIHKGFALLNEDFKFPCRYIPGTDCIIKESTRDGLLDALMKLKDECSGWHPPDAVCSLKQCQNFSHFYPHPNKDIFYRDPAFNGMVVITCSNSRFPCIMRFHLTCWKYQKEQLSTLKKLSDKDVIGYKCLTPTCESHKEPNTIMKVEVYGEDAQLKATIEGSSPVVWPTKVVPIKGAIKKQATSNPLHKLKKPTLIIPPQQKTFNDPKESKGKLSDELEIIRRVAILEGLREANFGITPEANWVPDQILYGNEHITETIHFIDFDVNNTQNTEIKVFIFDIFYEYLKNHGPLPINDVLKKWEETQAMINKSQEILEGFTDIIEFLLQSPKIVRLEDIICTAYDMPEAYRLLEDNTLQAFKFVKNDCNCEEKIQIHSSDTEYVNNQISSDSIDEIVPKVSDTSRAKVSEIPTNISIDDKMSTNLERLETTVPNIANDKESISNGKKVRSIVRKRKKRSKNVKTPNYYLTRLFAITDDHKKRKINIDKSLLAFYEYDVSFLFEESAGQHGELCIVKEPVIESSNVDDKHDDFKKEKHEDNSTHLSRTKHVHQRSSKEDRELVQDEMDLIIKENIKYENTVRGMQRVIDEPKEQISFLIGALRDSEAKNFWTKQRLLKRCLHHQYISNKHFIMGKMDACSAILEAFDSFVFVFEKIFGFRLPLSNTEWLQTLHKYHILFTEHQAEYIELDKKLDTKEEVDKLEDVTLKLTNIPAFPKKSFSEEVCEMFRVYQERAAQVMQSTIAPTIPGNPTLMHPSGLVNHLLFRPSMYQSNNLGPYQNGMFPQNLTFPPPMGHNPHSQMPMNPINNAIRLGPDIIVGIPKGTGNVKEEKLNKDIKDTGNLCTLENDSTLLTSTSIEDHNIEKPQAACVSTKNIEIDIKGQGHKEKVSSNAPPSTEKSSSKTPVSVEKGSSKSPISVEKGSSKSPISVEKGSSKAPAPAEEATSKAALSAKKVSSKASVPTEKVSTKTPVSAKKSSKASVPTEKASSKAPVPTEEASSKAEVSAKKASSKAEVSAKKAASKTTLSKEKASKASVFTEEVPLKPPVPAEKVSSKTPISTEKPSFKTPLSPQNTYAQLVASTATIEEIENNSNRNLPSVSSKLMKYIQRGTPNSSNVKNEQVQTQMSNKDKLNLLIMELKEEVIGIMELDIIESLEDVKRKNNGTLNGLTYSKIYNEAKKSILSQQKKYLDMYTKPEEASLSQTQKAGTSKNMMKVLNEWQRPKSTSLDRLGQKGATKYIDSSEKIAWVPITTPNEGWQKDYEETDCIICMFSINDKCKPTYTLTCKHTFHKICIKNWCKQSQSCPICRVHCTIDDEFPPLPS